MARLEKGNKTQVPQGQEQAFDEIVENLGSIPEFGPDLFSYMYPNSANAQLL